MLPMNTQVKADATAVAQAACEMISQAAQQAIAERGVFRLVLAGGSTPNQSYACLAGTVQDWARWEIFWGDERCLPADHAERNSRMVIQAWLSKVPIPPQNIHIIPADMAAENAATAYAHIIMDKFPFDLVLLGMGEDGHTASLFPCATFLAPPHDGDLGVQCVYDAPKPPAERVSLSIAALRNCRAQLVLVTGVGKAASVRHWRDSPTADLPIAQVVTANACLLMDQALADALAV